MAPRGCAATMRPNGIFLLRMSVTRRTQGSPGYVVAPEDSFQSCHGRVTLRVEPPQPRPRSRAHPLPTGASTSAHINALGEDLLPYGPYRKGLVRSNRAMILSNSFVLPSTALLSLRMLLAPLTSLVNCAPPPTTIHSGAPIEPCAHGVGSFIRPLTRCSCCPFPNSGSSCHDKRPLSGSSDLDALGDAVGLARVDLLARLGDGREHLLVGQVVLGHDGGGLALEGDLVRLDACDDDDMWLAVCSWHSLSVPRPLYIQYLAQSKGNSHEGRIEVGYWMAIGFLTLELLEHPVDGAGAPGAAHADVELVGVCVGHCDVC